MTELQELMFQCFVDGYSDPQARPSAANLFDALDDFQRRLKRCSRKFNHWFFEDLAACPWCHHRKRFTFDPFPGEKH